MSTLSRVLLMVLAGSLIFVGLPLVGWGIMDIAGFMDHPARAGYVVIMVLLQGVVAVKFPGVGRSGGKGQKLVRRQQLAVILLQVLSLAMVMVIPACDRHNIMSITDVVRYPGLLLVAVGFLLMNWSEFVLGRQFSIQVTIQANHQLVTAGPYQWVRHPRYLGIIVFNLGIALVFGSGVGVMLAASLMLVLLWRIQDEETLMRQEFGSAWAAYAQKTWHLIPLVY